MTFVLLLIFIILSLKYGKDFFKWSMFSLLFSMIFIFVGTFEELGFSDTLYGDQNYYMQLAQNMCGFSSSMNNVSFRYMFYPVFIYLSAPCFDYEIQSVLAKVNFALIWAIIIGILAFLVKSKDENNLLKYFILTNLVIIGGFFSSLVLRDGFVAIALILIFLPFILKRKKLLSKISVLIGLVLLLFTRPQFLPLLFVSWVYIIIIKSFFKSYHIVRVSIFLFVISIFLLLIIPIPESIASFVAMLLVPDGTTSENALVISKQEVFTILNSGGTEASKYIFNSLVSSLPSVFYNSNFLRTSFWIIFDSQYLGSEVDFRKYFLLLKALTEFIVWIVWGTIFWSFFVNKKRANSYLSYTYGYILVFSLLCFSLYATKYFGMDLRILLSFIVLFLIFFLFYPPSSIEVRNFMFPFLIIWLFLNLLYFAIKPYNWIWNYL